MGEDELAASLSTWAVLVGLPLLLVSCTAFTKISIVLAALRTGLGAERLLPFASMLGLGLVLTMVAMAPVGEEVWLELEAAGGVAGLAASDPSGWLALLEPLRLFMLDHASAEDLEFFGALAETSSSSPVALVPAFLVGEFGRALELAVLILLPFVVVDLIAAQILVLLGATQTPARVLALPAKVLLFLAASGWQTVVGGLIEGYR